MRKQPENKALRLVCIIGMSTMWPSLHNQLFYPLTFAFHKDGAPSLYPYYLVYSVAILVTVLALALNRRQVVSRLLVNRIAIPAFGALGAAGIALLVASDFSSNLGAVMLGIGIVLAAMYVPVHFMFWSMQLLNVSAKRVTYDLILSYLLFCVLTALRLAFHLHAWPFAIACPIVSAVLSIFAFKQPQKRYVSRVAPAHGEFSWRLIVPSITFVYLLSIGMCLLNPISATFDYPPYHRLMIYVVVAALMCLLAILYRPKHRSRKYASIWSFALLTALIAGALMLTGMGTLMPVNIGNFPAIAGKIAMELFVWLLIVETSQVKHLGIVRPAATYLVIVVGANNLISALIMGWSEIVEIESDMVPVLAITVVCAFVIVLAANVIIASFVLRNRDESDRKTLNAGREDDRADRRENAEENERPEFASAALPDGANGEGGSSEPSGPRKTGGEDAPDATPVLPLHQRMQETFLLSQRETDTLRLALRNASAKRIAAELYIAESTVNSHLKSIYRKCDVHSRKELIDLANKFREDGS